jgi:hypothetical protein
MSPLRERDDMPQSTKSEQFVVTYVPRPVLWCRGCRKQTDVPGQPGKIDDEQVEMLEQSHRCSEAPATAWDCRS